MEGQGTDNPWRLALAALALQGVLALLLAFSDLRVAQFYPDAVRSLTIHAPGGIAAQPQSWFAGEWGLRWALESQDGKYWSEKAEVRPGDLIYTTDKASSWPISVDPPLASWKVGSVKMASPFPRLALMSRDADAGYYSSGWGTLPFAITDWTLETLAVQRVEPAAWVASDRTELNPHGLDWISDAAGGNTCALGGFLQMGDIGRLVLPLEAFGPNEETPRRLAVQLQGEHGPPIVLQTNSDAPAGFAVFNPLWPRATHLPGCYTMQAGVMEDDEFHMHSQWPDPLCLGTYLDEADAEADALAHGFGRTALGGRRLIGAQGVEAIWDLGMGARISGLAMESGMMWGAGQEQGAIIGEWIVEDEPGREVERWPLRAGVDTAESAARRPDIASLMRHSFPDNRAVDRVEENGTEIYQYRASILFERPILAGRIRLVMHAPVILDVRTVALLGPEL